MNARIRDHAAPPEAPTATACASNPGVPSAPFEALGDASGLAVEYTDLNGRHTRRTYLDNAATTFRLGVVEEAIRRYLPHYASTHSAIHSAARVTSREYEWCHDEVLRFLNAPVAKYVAVFAGSGATGPLNLIAEVLRRSRPERPVAVVTAMEHHANDLPFRVRYGSVLHAPVVVHGGGHLGTVDLVELERLLADHEGQVSVVALTGVSNVTGIINPIHQASRMAHAHGALVVVDAAQMAPHVPIDLDVADPEAAIDALVLSGHKIYAPGAPGVLVARREILAGASVVDLGGGIVEDVSLGRFTLRDRLPDRLEPGTPNLLGAVGLGAALCALRRVGMTRVMAHEQSLVRRALDGMREVPGVVLYGDTDLERTARAGVISFNITGLHHEIAARSLNDYFNIAVRSGCFCAHPYVRQLLLTSFESGVEPAPETEEAAESRRGMVRASLGVYNTDGDVDRLLSAVAELARSPEVFEARYARDAHRGFVSRRTPVSPEFSIDATVEHYLSDISTRRPKRPESGGDWERA